MNNIAKKNIAAFCLASFFNDWCHEMGTAVLPMFIAQLVGGIYAPMILGLVQGVSDAASTIMKLISGFLADKLSFYKPFLVIGYGFTGIFIGLLGTAHAIWVVLAYKSFAWMTRGLREPMRDTWLSKIVPSTMYGRIFGIQRAFDSFGALIGPLCAFVLIKMNYSFSFIFFCAALPGIISALPIMLLTQEQEKFESKKTFYGYKEQLKQLPTPFISFLIIMFIFGIGNFNQMLIIYRIQELLSFGSDRLSLFATISGVLLYTFFNIIRALSEFGIGMLSDYIDKRTLLAVAGFGVFGITSCLSMFSTSSLLFWLVVVTCTGLSVGAVKVIEKSYASLLLPVHIRGTGLGLLQTVDGIGDLISSLIVGVLWSIYSPVAALLYAAVMSFVAMILFLNIQIFQKP
jgi:MFS family permease